jgi:hypothetical protein
MPATVLTTTLGAEFSPNNATFAVDVLNGSCSLLRSNTSGGNFAPVGDITGRAVDVNVSAAGSVFKLVALAGSPTINAYE